LAVFTTKEWRCERPHAPACPVLKREHAADALDAMDFERALTLER
jgi:hypothetical protein